MNKNIFVPADILLPDFDVNSADWQKWALIACDQFTSQKDYWDEVDKFIGDAMSTYSLVLPEAYLETEKEPQHKKVIVESMVSIPQKLVCHKEAMVYIERILPDGKLRRGIVGSIDLEKYDYRFENKPLVSATEETVLSRIPPRVNIRRFASMELPHIMVFYDDIEDRIMSFMEEVKSSCRMLYDFTLMAGGGAIKGYKLEGDVLDQLCALIGEYEASKGGASYAVGDGNHSLAGAKTYYEELKEQFGDGAEAHPARYALCEIVNIHESSIEFEPIYRIVKNVDVEALLASLPDNGRKMDAYVNGERREVFFPDVHPIDIGCLQIFIDEYLRAHPEAECDYIHGVEDTIELSKMENTVAFLCNGIEKDDLLSYVAENGSLPRKTFSMGEAKSKRYYIEARKI
ncbi:MAG: DUF1015 domain-containing protein [Clostridia bacterium]|nr:DUF1015 domain-containing protein [Clostridia bacterium]